MFRISLYRLLFKRIFDLVLSASLLVITFPFLLVITIGNLLERDGSVLFIQPRPGKDGNIFNSLKFKTMNEKRGEDGQLLSDKERLTKFGTFVRKTSLDELPQLINVIKGEMSLIGPRPLLVEYLPLYNEEQRRRHTVRPGITGWAQVNGRNNLEWEKRFECDIYYVDNLSFFLDIKIIVLTIVAVLKAKDVNQEGSSTMDKFTGS
ncbi:MAG: undecaprenyl phosphate N,N'-diacetylbacillosamine 1-phosphate transferase [Parvicella sp.]|jgi:undecaprenyl phosphate N,N'-diacetylbacillosamine 1-phosphate transferase